MRFKVMEAGTLASTHGPHIRLEREGVFCAFPVSAPEAKEAARHLYEHVEVSLRYRGEKPAHATPAHASLLSRLEAAGNADECDGEAVQPLLREAADALAALLTFGGS